MKIQYLLNVLILLIALTACKTNQPHPVLVQNPLQVNETGIVRYKLTSDTKTNNRLYKEAIALINSKGPYILTKEYLSSTQTGAVVTTGYYNNMANVNNNYSSFVNVEFKKTDDETAVNKWEGNNNMGKKDYSKALQNFQRLTELNPKNSEAYYDLARAQLALTQYTEAIASNTKAIELHPNFSMAYNNRGWAKYKYGMVDDALTDINKAIELDSKNATAYDSRQEIKFSKGDFSGCIEDCTTAIELNPDMDNSYLFRGKVYFNSGKRNKARLDWVAAYKLGNDEAYNLLIKNKKALGI